MIQFQLQNMNMEENLLLYSPESIDDSVLEYPSFQNDYENSIFNDFCIGLDKEDSLNLDITSQSLEQQQCEEINPVGGVQTMVKDNETAIGVAMPSFNSKLVSHKDSYPLNLNSADNPFSFLGVDKNKINPLKLCSITQQQENNRGKCYPVGDSNSKNAVAARDNRLKKKKYVAELEHTVKLLRTDNANLSKEVVENRKRLSSLESEVHYLKSVIANQTTLSAILNSVSKTPGISLATSFGDKVENVDKANTDIKGGGRSKKLPKPKPYDKKIRLRSQTKLNSKSRIEKSVQNMTAKEIVLCCKEKKMEKLKCVPDPEDSETDSDMEEIDVDDSLHRVKVDSPSREDYGGVCLHVTGNKVSLEFCASCNMKSNADVSLDHSYSSYFTK